MTRRLRGLALPTSALTPPLRGPAQAEQGAHTQNTPPHTRTHAWDKFRKWRAAGAMTDKRPGKTAGQSVRVVCFQRLGPSAGGPTEVPIYYKGVLRLGSSSAFVPPCLHPRARTQLKPKCGFPAIAPASHRALGLTSVRTQEEREPARLSCRTMNAGQDGPATRDRAIQGGWSLIVPADSANRLARMGHRHARSAARREAHIPENGKDGYIVIAMLMRLKKI